MSYASGIQEFIDRSNKVLPPDFYKLPVAKQRELYDSLTEEFHYELPANVSIKDHDISRDLIARVYTPKNIDNDGLLFYIRGGGFVIGSLKSHNSAVAELCEKTGMVTVAPDFRMAPEFPFPCALDDCYETLSRICDLTLNLNINRNKIVLCGDSSGANMAIVLSMMLRDRNGPKPCGQALISPVLDFSRWQKGGEDAPLLTGGEMEFFTACYAPDKGQVQDPYISPSIKGKFHDLPPTYIMGAEKDSLVVDSLEYAALLEMNNIKVDLTIEPGLVHSPIRARACSPQVADAWQRYCSAVASMANRAVLS